MKEKDRSSSLYRKVRHIAATRFPWLKRFKKPRLRLRDVKKRQDALEKQLEELKQQQSVQDEYFRQAADRNEVTDRRIRRLEGVDPAYAVGIVDRICQSSKLLKLLKLNLSIQPTVWGDASRLEIAPSASVFPCFFNVNSGKISIGEHTFAGSGVSILAGSHDPKLQGFLRRDAEMTEGHDIKIGNGVWLASNCTLLGPCTIGDNAIIAAGAVVIPGTDVPENTLYGGIPAKKIADLSFPEKDIRDDPAVLKALDRYSGVLYIDGWKPKVRFAPSPSLLYHTMIGEGKLMLSRRKWTLHYVLTGSPKCRVEMSGSDGKTFLTLTETDGKMDVVFPCEDKEIELISIRMLTEYAELSIALTEPDEQETETSGKGEKVDEQTGSGAPVH